jgi:hypothetical protein
MIKKDFKKGYLYNTGTGIIEILELYPKSFKMKLVEGRYNYPVGSKIALCKYKYALEMEKIGPKKQNMEYFL